MTPARFRECLRQIRWTSIDIVNALQCDVAFIEGVEAGEIDIPRDVADWLETLAECHSVNKPPLTCSSMALVTAGLRGTRTSILASR